MKLRVQPCSFPAVLVLALAVLTAACSGGSGSSRSSASASCRQSPDSATWLAVLSYIKNASPYPQRFMTPALTDSALPEVGVAALQEKGPTYFFPPDSAGRLKLRKKLDDVGPYTSLLVSWHGMTREADSALVIRLSGTYINGKFDGNPAAPKVFRFHCANGRWALANAVDEKKS